MYVLILLDYIYAAVSDVANLSMRWEIGTFVGWRDDIFVTKIMKENV